MAFKFVSFAALLAVAQAGVVDYGYAAAPAASSHASFSQHTVAHAAPLAYAAPAYKVAAPAVAYAHAAPAVHYAHAAPVAHYAHAAPVAHYAAPIAKAIIAEPSAPAHYDFEYAVHDPHTGDVKSQKESREGDAVHGSYSLVEADGSKRTVEYTADAHNGFNAVVHREPAQHAVAVKAVAPIIKYAAPVVKTIATPQYASYAAPDVGYASYAHAAPAHQYYH